MRINASNMKGSMMTWSKRRSTCMVVACVTVMAGSAFGQSSSSPDDREWGPPPPPPEDDVLEQEGGNGGISDDEPLPDAEPSPGDELPPEEAIEPELVPAEGPDAEAQPIQDIDIDEVDDETSVRWTEPSHETDASAEGNESDGDGEEGEEDSPSRRERMAEWFRSLPLHPFLVIAAGFRYEHKVPREDLVESGNYEEGRFDTISVSRLGLEGEFGDHVMIRSEIELSAGFHGTSVWEGGGTFTLRDQYIGLRFGGFRLYAGRITDPASIDYMSSHVLNLLATDRPLRDAYMRTGANRGNGVVARYEVVDGLNLGITVNAGNPASFTGNTVMGGSYSLYESFHQAATSTVRDSPSRFPNDQYWAILASPSLSFDWEYLRTQISYQFIYADLERKGDVNNVPIRGHNIRGGFMGMFWNGRIRPFFNLSFGRNEVPDGNDSTRVDSIFETITVSSGLDVDISGRSGLGIQYNYTRGQQGDYADISSAHFFNVGGSWWFVPTVAAELRYGYYTDCINDGYDRTCDNNRIHQIYLNLRGEFGGQPARRATQSPF